MRPPGLAIFSRGEWIAQNEIDQGHGTETAVFLPDTIPILQRTCISLEPYFSVHKETEAGPNLQYQRQLAADLQGVQD
jgi:hypothetical protein